MGLLSSIAKVGRTVSKATDNLPIKDVQPTKTRSAYRITTQAEDGKLYPLFVNASDEIPVGQWVSATVPPVTFKGINGNMYVPSKGAARSKGEKSKATGDMQVLPNQETMDQLREEGFSVEKPSKSAPFGRVRAVASRPGFHATTKPVAHHLGPEDLIISSAERDKLLKAGVTPKAFKEKTFYYLDGKLIGKAKIKNLSDADKKKVTSKKKYYVKRRAEDQVFVEVDMADDTSEDLLRYMQDRGRTDIDDKLPSGGSYTYQDGQADAETWVVGGDMRVNRVLSREEAKAAQEAAGVKDLPYRDEIEKILERKFAKGGLAGEVGMYTGQEDSILAASYAEGGILTQTSVELNKGGTPMKRQMEMFNEGGLNQEGGMVDEVSGNEVPMGSTREEVRDDIPAQVSEGEFIFPADVVRYLGLEKLMKLRQTAKMGLKQMDAMGQMGNSDEATMPDDMPFGIADLVVIDGPDEEEPQKKYKGGLSFANGGISMPDFDRSSQDVRIYVKEGSPDRRVPFFNGEPVISIENLLAQGYVLKGSEPVEETETEEAIPTRKSSDRTPMKKTPFQEAGGWSMKLGDPPDPAKVKLWTDEYAKTSGRTPAVLTGIATVIGGPLGILVHLANKGNAKSAAANYERVLKAAQQTNVKGQVKALRDINTEVIKGKEGEDKSILVKIIDGLKDALGFSDDEVNEAVTVAGKSDQETPEEKTAKEAARLAAIKNFRDEEDKLFNDQSMTVAEGEKITAEAAATAKAAAAKTETERMLSINDPKGTSLEDKAEVERMLSINDPKGTSLEDKAAREAKEAAATAANVAAKKAAAAERIKNTELVSTIPNAAVATTDTDAALEAGAAPEAPKVSGPDPNNLFSPRNQITAGAGQLGFDINTIDNTTLNNMEVAINEINSGADAGEAITRVNPNVGLALQNLAQTYFTGGVDSMADFTFGSSTGVERDGRSNEEIVSTALESFDDESLARIDAGTNRFEEQRKKEAEEAKAARKAKRRPQELKEELKQKADFNARATKGSENLALKRSIARAREAVPTRTNDELINIAKQTVAGQAAGKGYVGGFGFKKGGLASRRK